MRIFIIFIIIFSVSGTVWSMWMSGEIKNEDSKLKKINNKILDIDEKIRLVDAEWAYLTSSKNLEYLNSKYLKLKAMPIKDISFYTLKNNLGAKDNIFQNSIKEIN
tara:strand:- start:450 stop:767 length:318 start_codon:yes stop_codon:yes gene_type:complete